MYLVDLTQAHSSSKGSVFIEAAMVFPLVIAIMAVSITTSLNLYSILRDNSIEHKQEINKQYEIYEKGRLLISIYSDSPIFTDGTA